MIARYRFRFDVDHLIESTRRYYRARVIIRGWNVFRYLIALPIAWLAWLCWLIGETWLANLSVAAVITLLFTWPLQKLLLRYTFRQSPFRNEDVAADFTTDGVHIKGAVQDTRLTWQAYTSARRLKDGMLLFQGPSLYSWMPDSAASDSTAVAALRDLARTHVRDYREV